MTAKPTSCEVGVPGGAVGQRPPPTGTRPRPARPRGGGARASAPRSMRTIQLPSQALRNLPGAALALFPEPLTSAAQLLQQHPQLRFRTL